MNEPARPTRRLPIAYLVAAMALAALATLAVLAATGRPRATFHGTAYEPPEPAPDFTLTEHTGRTVRLRDLRGRVVLLFFGYTHCPDVCPLTLDKLHRVLDDLGAGPDRARILLVTVDPERDTPEALSRYLARFGAGVSGLTGPPETLRRLYAAYGVHAQPGQGSHPGMMHTSAVFGIDRSGQLRVLLRHEHPDAELASDLRTLLEL